MLFTIPNFNPTPPKFVEIYSNITVVEEVKAGLVFTVRAFDLEDNDVVFDLPPSQYSGNVCWIKIFKIVRFGQTMNDNHFSGKQATTDLSLFVYYYNIMGAFTFT